MKSTLLVAPNARSWYIQASLKRDQFLPLFDAYIFIGWSATNHYSLLLQRILSLNDWAAGIKVI